ncbi:MAG: helix-turn-helix domain-containing protein [Candidatus Magasanikbacteria bacterium]
MLENELAKLGFGKNEAIVYLALIDLQKAKAGQIISKTGLHRNLVYTALEELVKRDMVSKAERKGVFEFSANGPEHIIEDLENKRKTAENLVSELQKRHKVGMREVGVFEGVEAIKNTTERSADAPPGETMYVLGATRESTEGGSFDWKDFHKRRIKKNVNFKILFDHTVEQEILDDRNKKDLTEARYLPFDAKMPLWFNFCYDKLSIMVIDEDPLVFHIRSRTVVDAMKKYFEYFWSQQVVVETGIGSLKKTIYKMLDELKTGEEYFVLGASAGDENGVVQKLYDEFHTDRIKKGVVANMLVYSESFDRIKKRFVQSGDGMEKISHLKLYASAPKIPMQINLFHNKAFIILYGENPTVIHFAQPEIYAGFKSYFDQLWGKKI